MFRTKLDMEMIKQDKRGSPFFNLRVSIRLILELCIDNPKVCTDLQLPSEKNVVFSVFYIKNSFSRFYASTVLINRI